MNTPTEEPKYTNAEVFLNGNDDITEKSGEPIAGTCFRPNFATTGNARLLKAAWNAFISAGEKLNINPVLLAERLENGGIAEIVEALIPMTKGISIRDVANAEKALSLVKGEPHV